MLHKFSCFSTMILPLILLTCCQQTPTATAANLVQHKPQQHASQQHATIQQQHVQQAQYVHDKDAVQDVMKNDGNVEEDINDPYQMLNEMKQEPRLPTQQPGSYFPWNMFPQLAPLTAHQATPTPPPPPPPSQHNFESLSSSLHMPKFLPFFGYPQPIFIPYPLYITPDMFFSAAAAAGFTSSNDVEESMSRAADARRSASNTQNSGYQRNSPIYYMRLPPPTPYMFLPGLGFTAASSAALNPTQSAANSFGTGYSSMLPYGSLPSFSPYSSIINLPVNFLANGKPTNIYQMGGSPNDIQQSPIQFPGFSSFGARPPPPNPYRPNSLSSMQQSSGNYLPQSPYGPAPQQDSKLTALKRPFIFNGRPEEIYILPNNFSPLYADSGLPGYY